MIARMTLETPQDHVRAEIIGGVMIITLDRPKALNALTLEMVRAIHAHVQAAQAIPEIVAVIIEGAGGRAFCAGGDVRAVATSIGTESDVSERFFRAEYAMNRLIHRFPKPFIALVQGISMGGGVGISIHGRVRVVTDTLTFAMPETGIGLFPDVGGGWFLPRMPGELGTYLALTGAKIGAADAAAVGYATHVIANDRLADARAALIAAQPADRAAVNAVLKPFAINPGRASLAEHRALIDRCFAKDNVESIIESLSAETSPFAAQTLATLATRSPTSLKLTLRQIRLGRTLEIEEALMMEFRMGQRVMAGHDFREGIRAVLIDKDNRPNWRPATLAEVSDAAIDAYFAPLDGAELGWGMVAPAGIATPTTDAPEA